MRDRITFSSETKHAVRLTSTLDPTKYSVEECGEHASELSNHVQGLHDFVLEDVDELLCAGMRYSFTISC